jgi:hypothetical protein
MKDQRNGGEIAVGEEMLWSFHSISSFILFGPLCLSLPLSVSLLNFFSSFLRSLFE